MSAKRRKDYDRIVAMVGWFPHHEALLIMRGLNAYADVLAVVDKEFPDPEHRKSAAQCHDLAEMFGVVNTVRDHVTGKEDG